MDDSGLELNLVFNQPKAKVVAERVQKRAEWRENKKNDGDRATAARRERGASSGAASSSSRGRGGATRGRGGATRGGRGGARSSSTAGVKRKAPSTDETEDAPADGEERKESNEIDQDGDERMANDNDSEDDIPAETAAERAASKAEAWKSIKQARYEGDSNVKSSVSFSDPSPADSSSSTAPSSSSSAKKPSATTPYRPPTSKPLPKIIRAVPTRLSASELKPVQMTEENRDVFDADESMEERKDGGGQGGDDSDDDEDVDVKPEPKVKQEEHYPDLPTTGFGALGLSPRLLNCLTNKLGLKYPTKIQKEGIPLLIKDMTDALIKSETGTGKTLTYLIPIIEVLTSGPSNSQDRVTRASGTRAIILSPTRELCIQIHSVLSGVLEKAGIYWLIAGSIMGGEKKNKEKSRLRKGINILICTPGRLLDHLENTECFLLTKLEFFVLDEADRLMDMGFEKDLTKIVKLLDEKSGVTNAPPNGKNGKANNAAAKKPTPSIVDPRTGLEIKSAKTRALEAKAAEEQMKKRRKNILVSATLNKEIESMAQITLKNPVMIGFKTNVPSQNDQEESKENGHIKIEDADGEVTVLTNSNTSSQLAAQQIADTSLPKGLIQLYLQVEHRHKLVALASLLRKKVVESEMQNRHFKAVVFFSTCAAVEFHYSLMKYSYWPYDKTAGGIEVEKNALVNTPLLKLHGTLTQQERTRTYKEFYSIQEGILFCTDVAARGLDLPAVDTIFQYDAPEDIADYIHRVGRTARMGRKGQAILFLVTAELAYLDKLKEKGITPEPLSFAHILQSLHSDAAKNRIYDDARGGSPAGAILQKQFESLVGGQLELKESAINAYHAFLRAYAAYPRTLKTIFHPRSLHIGHVARSFGLQDAPTLLAKSEIVQKQKEKEEREKEKEKYRMEISGGANGGDANKQSDRMKKKLVPAPQTIKSGPPSSSSSSDPSSSIPSSQPVESISSGIRPAFGHRDRLHNKVAQANDAAWQARPKGRKMETSSVGWKIGAEQAKKASQKKSTTGAGGKPQGIDRARSNAVAQVFKKKKMDLMSEFA